MLRGMAELAALRRKGTAEQTDTRRTSSGVHATLRVLDLLALRGSLQLSELARELGLAKSTLHRICSILLERGWVVRDREGRFDLGIRALRLGSRSEELPIVVGFRSVAAGFLTRHDETIALAVLDGDESLFVAIEETSHPVRLVTHVGRSTPAFASASGRVVLAAAPPETVAALFGGRPLVTPTGRRLNGVPELLEILEAVRAQGYAENHEETAVGLYAASVPVVNGRGVVLAALTSLVPTSRLTGQRRAAIVGDLVDAGRILSDHVGWLSSYPARRP
jgi:DNA-binding IclR family transcriptional regulator